MSLSPDFAVMAALLVPTASFAIHMIAAAATRRAAIGTRFASVSLLPTAKDLPLGVLAGASLTALFLLQGTIGLAELCALLAVALLGAAAIADARWAWAPDSLMVPLAIVAPLAAGHGGWSALLLSAMLIGIPLIAWLGMNLLNRSLMTPPDIMALLLPPALFGFSYTSVGVYLATAMLLLAALRISALRGSSSALDDAGDHTGLSHSHPDRARVALLGVTFPILLLALTLTRSGIL